MPPADQTPSDTPADEPGDRSDHPNGPADVPADAPANEPVDEPVDEPAGGPAWRLVARVLVGLEAIVPLAFAIFGVAQLVSGGSVVQRNEAMLVGLLAVVGLALLYVAYAVGQGRRAVRSATLLWQALLVLALVPAMWEAGRQGPAVAVVVLAVLTGYATVRATSAD